MARKFFLIAAGMFLLALSYHVGASGARASSAPVAQPSEGAALSGVLHDGQTIPLPTYSDGTLASESECQWTVSAAFTNGESFYCYAADAVYGEPGPYDFQDNTAFYSAHRGRVMNCGLANGSQKADGNYLIVATRGASLPTPALHESWGQLKSRYRATPPATPGMMDTPGASNR